MRAPFVVLGAIALAGGCASRPLAPTALRPWTSALVAAQEYAGMSRFEEADSVLQAFAATYPTSADTLDVLFWRAFYRADPANPADGALAEATALLERYLNAQAPQPYRYEAQALQRFAAIRALPPEVRVDTVVTIDTLAVREAVTREVEARDRLHEEEAQVLRDSLTRATAELERIRRRLSPPRP